jgi:hypothetical protein
MNIQKNKTDNNESGAERTSVLSRHKTLSTATANAAHNWKCTSPQVRVRRLKVVLREEVALKFGGLKLEPTKIMS